MRLRRKNIFQIGHLQEFNIEPKHLNFNYQLGQWIPFVVYGFFLKCARCKYVQSV